MPQFYIQLDSNNIIRDVITYPYNNYVQVDIPVPLTAGINGGWYRWDGERPVYDRVLFEQANEVPELQAAKEEYETVKPIIAGLAQTTLASGGMNETQVAELAPVFPTWNASWLGSRGSIVRDEGNLYKSMHDVTNAAQNTKPGATPSMWTRISNPVEEWPEWIPWDGTVRYQVGSKVAYQGKRYVSTIPNNAYAPNVYGWTEQK